jgi:hypothetical protein
VSDWQRNELIDTIRSRAAGELTVHVARWPDYPGGKNPQVMWVDMGQYRYLPPEAARRFAAALVRGADEIEGQSAE